MSTSGLQTYLGNEVYPAIIGLACVAIKLAAALLMQSVTFTHEKTVMLRRRLKRRRHISTGHTSAKCEDLKADGWVLGYWFLAHFARDGDGLTSWVWMPRYACNQWITAGEDDDDDDDDDDDEDRNVIKRMELVDKEWIVMKTPVPTDSVSAMQKGVCDRILEMADMSAKRGNPRGCVALVCGGQNIGKSFIGKLLALRWDADHCDSFSGAEGDSLSSLKYYCDGRLVLVIDEADEWALKMLRSGGKKALNAFMERFSLYDNLIVLLTSNKPVSWFDMPERSRKGVRGLLHRTLLRDPRCPSNFRPGRVNLMFEASGGDTWREVARPSAWERRRFGERG